MNIDRLDFEKIRDCIARYQIFLCQCGSRTRDRRRARTVGHSTVSFTAYMRVA